MQGCLRAALGLYLCLSKHDLSFLASGVPRAALYVNVLRDHVLDISREALGEPHYVNVLRAYRVDIPDVIAPMAALRAPKGSVGLH